MRSNFVKTENTTRFLSGLQALHNRGAEEACLMIVDGEVGLGKTRTIHWWATQQENAYVRAKKEWTPVWMLKDILLAVGKKPVGHRFEKLFRQCLEVLTQRATEAEETGTIFAVAIDEVDHITRSPRLLESLRDLSDLLEIPFVLVGMGRVRDDLSRYPQISSRIAQVIEFKKITITDAAALATGLCEVEIGDGLLNLLLKSSKGLTREFKEGLNNIERFGVMNNLDMVTIKNMTGQILMNNRHSNRAVKVQG